MRKLSKRQKNYLDKLWDEMRPTSVDEIPYQRWIELVEMNDHETIWQGVNQYLFDKIWSERR